MVPFFFGKIFAALRRYFPHRFPFGLFIVAFSDIFQELAYGTELVRIASTKAGRL
jgi:hypothetical protein